MLTNNTPLQEENVNDSSMKELFLSKEKGFLGGLGYLLQVNTHICSSRVRSMVFAFQGTQPPAARKSTELDCRMLGRGNGEEESTAVKTG